MTQHPLRSLHLVGLFAALLLTPAGCKGGEGAACLGAEDCKSGVCNGAVPCAAPTTVGGAEGEGEGEGTTGACVDVEGTCSAPAAGGSVDLPDVCDDKWDCPDTYICHVLTSDSGECLLGGGKACTDKSECQALSSCGKSGEYDCFCEYGAQLDNGSCYERESSSSSCNSDADCPSSFPTCMVATDALNPIPGQCTKPIN